MSLTKRHATTFDARVTVIDLAITSHRTRQHEAQRAGEQTIAQFWATTIDRLLIERHTITQEQP